MWTSSPILFRRTRKPRFPDGKNISSRSSKKSIYSPGFSGNDLIFAKFQITKKDKHSNHKIEIQYYIMPFISPLVYVLLP